MKNQGKLKGLIAAAFTPMKRDGSINLRPIPAYVDFLINEGIRGIYVAGSTGEGVSLTSRERRQLTEAFVQAAAGRIPVIVQVGHNSAWEARELAAHAQEAGADAVSSSSPSYFKPASVQLLVDAMATLAEGAPDLPFYYYHIPALTGVPMDMVEFLERGARQIPTLTGIKFSDTFVPDYQACLELDDRRFDILWGCDEMLLSGLVVGAEGAVGSTYNVAAPLYMDIIRRMEAGDMAGAREEMYRSVQMVRLLSKYTKVTTGLKEAILPLYGFDFGRSRLPVQSMSEEDAACLREEWIELGFACSAPSHASA